MLLSVVIPTYNEAENIGTLLDFLIKNTPKSSTEIIVSDGGSIDNTCFIAKKYNVKVVESPEKGRAAQMNFGVSQSSGEILQFVHADTTPPKTFYNDILQAIDEDYPAGCFTYCFDSSSWILKVNAYFTQFDKLWCRGGDQAIFIKRAIFEEFGGYRNDYLIMEEYDLLKKIFKKYPFRIIKNDAIVSARKYENNSYMRVQIANFLVFNMYRFGYSQQKMVNMYRRILN
ncbi:MAG: TIGR04283 family arsenosugar biosynthesis glycosyltransferase [Saprospiraceae bacterium]